MKTLRVIAANTFYLASRIAEDVGTTLGDALDEIALALDPMVGEDVPTWAEEMFKVRSKPEPE